MQLIACSYQRGSLLHAHMQEGTYCTLICKRQLTTHTYARGSLLHTHMQETAYYTFICKRQLIVHSYARGSLLDTHAHEAANCTAHSCFKLYAVWPSHLMQYQSKTDINMQYESNRYYQAVKILFVLSVLTYAASLVFSKDK